MVVVAKTLDAVVGAHTTAGSFWLKRIERSSIQYQYFRGKVLHLWSVFIGLVAVLDKVAGG